MIVVSFFVSSPPRNMWTTMGVLGSSTSLSRRKTSSQRLGPPVSGPSALYYQPQGQSPPIRVVGGGSPPIPPARRMTGLPFQLLQTQPFTSTRLEQFILQNNPVLSVSQPERWSRLRWYFAVCPRGLSAFSGLQCGLSLKIRLDYKTIHMSF